MCARKKFIFFPNITEGWNYPDFVEPRTYSYLTLDVPILDFISFIRALTESWPEVGAATAWATILRLSSKTAVKVIQESMFGYLTFCPGCAILISPSATETSAVVGVSTGTG